MSNGHHDLYGYDHKKMEYKDPPDYEQPCPEFDIVNLQRESLCNRSCPPMAQLFDEPVVEVPQTREMAKKRITASLKKMGHIAKAVGLFALNAMACGVVSVVIVAGTIVAVVVGVLGNIIAVPVTLLAGCVVVMMNG
jgi:hypothetical protein